MGLAPSCIGQIPRETVVARCLSQFFNTRIALTPPDPKPNPFAGCPCRVSADPVFCPRFAAATSAWRPAAGRYTGSFAQACQSLFVGRVPWESVVKFAAKSP
jgi:hypothetical protein